MDIIKLEEYQVTDKHALHSEITCKFCDSLLSVPPIYYLEYESGLGLEACGRCFDRIHKHPENKLRQHVYENMAKHVTFPCAYKDRGCSEVLKWGDVVEHESNCLYAKVRCPIAVLGELLCTWEDSAPELTNHVNSEHEGCFMDPPHFDEFPLISQVFFTNACERIFMIVFLKRSEKKWSVCVLVRGGELIAHRYRYQVELSNASKTNSIILRKNRVENWFHVNSVLCREESLLEIDCDVIENLIKQDPGMANISIRFGIVKKSKKEIKQLYEAVGQKYKDTENNHSKNGEPDEKFLAELECPVCQEFMVPPIYICSNGHSLCNECLTKVQSCPNCRCPLGNTRNFTLENITTKVLYNCRNKDAGCFFTATSENIRQHEKCCNLSDFPCLKSCGLNFRKTNLWSHMSASHKESVLTTGEIHKRDVNQKNDSHFFNSTAGEIFRLSIKGSVNTNYKFNVQWLGDEKEKPRFQYTLEIVDKSLLRCNIAVTSLIYPLNETPFKQNNITLSWDMMKPFVLENGRVFHFKYSIFPINTNKV